MSTRAERTTVIDGLEQEFKKASGIFLTDHNKINVEKITRLRTDLRKEGIKFKVVKNNLAREACKRLGIQELEQHFTGQTAVVVADEDGAAPAKILKNFQKEHKLLAVKAAYVDGTVFSSQQAAELADLPSREVLLSMLLSAMKAPIGNMAGVLNGIMTKFVRTLDALKEHKS